ncbi:Nephrocystin-4 [Dirofilaria immitis]
MKTSGKTTNRQQEVLSHYYQSIDGHAIVAEVKNKFGKFSIMSEDESRMNITNKWYQRVQMCRLVPPRRSPVDQYDTPKCYALSLRNAQLPSLKMDMLYRIHAYFYDKQQKYYFGKPFYGRWYRSDSDSVLFTEIIFFWCSFIDNIDIVLEVVEGEQEKQNSSCLYTAAWTLLPLGSTENSIVDYSSPCDPLLFRRLPLYLGSPKALFFMTSEMNISGVPPKTNIGLEICLQTHQKMCSVLDFIPEWYMFGKWEDIPGLRTSYDGESQIVLPEALESRKSILSKIKLSFGMSVYKFEQFLLHMMNNDRLYRANRSPADINVKMMQVLERRITVGVHNGLCYVEKPQCLHLSLLENQLCNALEMRRNQLTNKSNLTLHSQSLFINGSVILNRLITDGNFAVVFLLDYLVGVYSCDGTVHSSQSVMVCWGAWCPFAVDITTDDKITVPLLGGPNINPDERLAFKNSLSFRSDLSFCDQSPNIKITFVYAGLREIKKLLDTPICVSSKSQLQNAKRRNMETIGLQLNSTKTAHYSKRRHENRLEIKSSPLASQEKEKFDGKIAFNDKQKYDIYTSVEIHSLPLVRTSNIPRASLAILADVSFAPIKDRNGNRPKLVNIENCPAPDFNIELNDKLNTNETIVQFMAIRISCREDDFIKIPAAVLSLHILHSKKSLQGQLFVLRRRGSIEDIVKEDCNGFTIRYVVDRNSLPDGDEDDYINYLSNGHAIVDVWDADSLLPLGKSCIPLKSLLRHGSEAVQADLQSAVVLKCFSEPSITTCEVLLRIASIGHPCFKQIDLKRNTTNAIVSRQLIRIGQNENGSYRIRAKPLNPIHENSLQRFIAAQILDINQRYNEITNNSLLEAKKRSSITKSITKGSVKRYLFQQELEAYKKLRNEDKASKLLKVVFKAITTEYRIYPKYGQIIFFEYMLQNTEPESAIIIVDIAQNTLKPLLNIELWQYYKNIYGIETPLEKDLYQISRENEQTEVRIFLKPMETICAPFIYDGFTLPEEQIRNQVKIIFRKKIGGEPIAILDLLVENRHNIISNSFRFYHEAETTLSRIIHITGYKNRIFSIRCTDPLVLTSFKNNCNGSQDLHFTCQTGKAPMLRTFTVIFFADQYCSTVLGAWLINVHAVNQISLNAVRAQIIKVPISLKTSGNYDGLVHFGSSLKNFEIYPSDAVIAENGGTLDAVVNFLPNFTGSHMMLVSATDQQTNYLLYQWMIAVNVQEANITKMFEVYLQNSSNQTITLAVKNRYSVERSFRISCSHPEYVEIKNDIVMLSGYKIAKVSVTFLLNKGLKLPEVLIFITNIENNLQEEAYSVKLIYQD